MTARALISLARSSTVGSTLVPRSSRHSSAGTAFSGVSSGRPLVGHRCFWSTAKQEETQVQVVDPLVVCGPSGVGKGTIIERYMKEKSADNDLSFAFTVSHTTRQPRPGETNGVHYHFVSHQEMARLIEEEAFLEHAEVHGNIYGTSWASLQAIHADKSAKRRALLDIDVSGVQSMKALEFSLTSRDAMLLQPKYLFIAPPDVDTLEKRLEARGTETAEALETRTANAAAELDYGLSPGNFDAIVYNHEIDQAVADFAEAVHELYH